MKGEFSACFVLPKINEAKIFFFSFSYFLLYMYFLWKETLTKDSNNNYPWKCFVYCTFVYFGNVSVTLTSIIILFDLFVLYCLEASVLKFSIFLLLWTLLHRRSVIFSLSWKLLNLIDLFIKKVKLKID